MQTVPRSRPAPVFVQPARANGRKALWVILPALLLFYASLLPPEIRISVAGQTLYPPRLVGFGLLPWLLWQLVRRPMRFNLLDYMIFFSCFWMVFAFIVYYGFGTGLLRGGALAFDVLIPFLVCRMCFHDSRQFRRFLVLTIPGLLFAGLSMMAEALLTQPLVRPAAAAIFGALPAYENGVAVGEGQLFIDKRLGILRAMGPFSHPIHAGLFMASFLPLFGLSGLIKWPRGTGTGASLLAIFSASSAAFLAILIALFLLGLERLQRLVSFLTWQLNVILISAMLLVAHLVSENGIVNVFIRYALNPTTARFRRLIWRYGTASVEKHPWFGIGFTDYERLPWMVPSVDNYWLLLAIRFGLLPAVMIFIVCIAAIWLLALRAPKMPEVERRLRVGIAISLFGLSLLAFTVSIYGGIQTWFYMLLGVTVSMAGLGSAGLAPPSRAIMARPPHQGGIALPRPALARPGFQPRTLRGPR